MDKLRYSVRTLSRTKRKDYENYVVNAVWNRLGDSDLKPVTQQLIIKDSTHRYFIDLYFPQLNMGIECNEMYHRANGERDEARRIDIIDILDQVRHVEQYVPLNVDVFKRVPGTNEPDMVDDSMISLQDFDEQIDNVVERLKRRKREMQVDGAFRPWEESSNSPERYYRDKKRISVDDAVGFRTMVQACNVIFQAGYEGLQRPLLHVRNYLGSARAWFPKRTVAGHAVAGQWNNVLSDDGKEIYERNEGHDALDDATGERRIVFMYMFDPMSNESVYRFVGVFERDDNRTLRSNRCRHYRRIREDFDIIHS